MQIYARFLQRYDVTPTTIEFLPLGLDTRAGVYRVASAEGQAFLLKAKQGGLYEASCQVPRYLREQGIASVVAPLPTNSNTLWTQLAEWNLILYPFIEGASGWEPEMNDGQWQAAGKALRLVHDCSLATDDLEHIRRQSFDPSDYARQIQKITAHFAASEDGDEHARALRAEWLARQPTIDGAMAAMNVLAETLQENAAPFVICHGDLHQNNIIRTRDGGVFIIDWDEVMLAPKERDFLWVGDPPADATASEGDPFFQGYGPAAIDWVALTYYRWERTITDVIECAESVCFREDTTEVTRAREAQLFHDILADDNEILAATQRAAAHLPPDLAHKINMASPKL